ncbi:MAG: Chromosome partitioning protein [Anaerolineae bacterium]|nr:MAG: Chromosome partitioning protein [Anaerolineae bacterium]
MNDWGSTLQQAADQVTVILAGPTPRVQSWYMVLVGDARFRVTMQATEAADLAGKLVTNPDILLVDAMIFSGLQPTVSMLTSFGGLAYVVLPAEADQHAIDTIKQVPCVKGVWKGDLNLPELTGKMYGDVQAIRQSARSIAAPAWNMPTSSLSAQMAVGLRIVAVWNQAGGVGKTTVASNLAYDAARRGLPTLLIGLGAPDDLPLILGLKPAPNITLWRANPTPDGLKAAVQKVDTLDVLAGFPDVLSEAQAIATPLDADNSIPKLAITAAYLGYAVIVLDAPPTALASAAITAANTLVLVARPSLEGIMRTVEAYRTVVERLAGEHRISPNGVFVVLNRVGGRMTADEWHRGASSLLGRAFPPIVAQIPDDPQVGEMQDARRLPLHTCDGFARGLKPLGDALFGGLNIASNKNGKEHEKTLNLFGIRVKL